MVLIRRPSPLQQGLIALAVALALVGQWRLHHNPSDMAGWFLHACVLVVAAVAGWEAHAGTVPIGIPSQQGPSRLWRLLWGGAAMLAVAAATILSARNQWPGPSIIFWAMGCLLGRVAVGRWMVSPPGRVTPVWSRTEVAALAALVVVGAAARVVGVGSLPRFYFADEARLGWSVVLGYRVGIPNFFTMGWNGWPWAGISLQGLFGPLLGVTISSLRMSSALVGTLAIVTTYLLAREMFGLRVALLAAVLFTVCRTAIDYSRLGVCLAQVMFLETLAFFWWWRAVNTGRASSYWWAGIGLGLCVLTYNSGDLVPLLWFGWLGLIIVFAPRSVRSHWRGAAITAAGFLAAGYPWVDYITDHLSFGPTWAHWTIIARNRQIMGQVLDAWHVSGAGAAAAILWQHVRLTWLGFGVLPEGTYNLGYRGGGMLDDVTAALFVTGLAMSIPWWRRAREGFVLYWWIVTTVAGGVITIGPPAITRLLGLLPALMLLAARPLDWLWRTGAGSRARTAAAAALAAGLIGVAAWDNWQTYFVAFANAPLPDPVSAVGRRLEPLPPGSTAFMLGGDEHVNFFYELFQFNFPGRRLQDVPDPAHLVPLHQPVGFPVVLMLGPSQTTLAAYVRELYPHTEVTDDIFPQESRLGLRELRLVPEDVVAQTGLRLTVYDSANAVVSQTTGDPFASALVVPNTGARLQWTGRIYWPTDRPVTLTVHGSKGTEVRLGDDSVVRIDAGSGSRDAMLSLPRGWQLLTITEPAVADRAFSMAIVDRGARRTMGAWDLNPNSVPEGLSAVYTQEDGKGPVRTIDPQLNSFAEEFIFQPGNDPIVRLPFSVSWNGALRVTTPGVYTFEARGTGSYSVRLDDAGLVDTVQASGGAGSGAVSGPERVALAERTLTAGLHKLEAQWTSPRPAQGTRRLFQLYWTPPRGERQLIPPPNFVPVFNAEGAAVSAAEGRRLPAVAE